MLSDEILDIFSQLEMKDNDTQENTENTHENQVNEDNQDKCQHTKIEADICVDCGRMIKGDYQEYDKNWNIDQKSIKLIYNELSKMQFPDIIVKEADELYKKIITGKKEKSQKKAVRIACIYYAYCMHPELGKISSDNILSRFGTKGKVFKGFEIVSKYTKTKTYGTPLDFIKDTLNLFVDTGADHYEKILELYDKIKNAKEMDDPRPQSTSKALVFYYILKNNINIDFNTYCEKVKLSKATITKIIKIICNILDTPEVLDKISKRRKK